MTLAASSKLARDRTDNTPSIVPEDRRDNSEFTIPGPTTDSESHNFSAPPMEAFPIIPTDFRSDTASVTTHGPELDSPKPKTPKPSVNESQETLSAESTTRKSATLRELSIRPLPDATKSAVETHAPTQIARLIERSSARAQDLPQLSDPAAVI